MIQLTTSFPVKFSESNGVAYIEGYAAVFPDGTPGTKYKPLPNVEVTISPAAFDEVLAKGDTVEAWFNHSEDFVLASTRDKSLMLEKDAKGLRFWIKYDADDPQHVTAKRKLEKGYITGCSFQAMASASMVKEGELYRRTIENVDSLKEVSLCYHPAFSGTSATMSFSADALKEEIARWEKTQQRKERAKLYTTRK